MDQSVVHDIGLTVLGLTVFLLIYTLPAFVAYVRDHQHFGRILTINVLLGFLVLPWLATLGYAALSNKKVQPQ